MDDPDENAGDEPPPGNVKKKNLTGGQVKQIVSQLLLLVKEGDENHSLKYLRMLFAFFSLSEYACHPTV